MTAGVKVEGRNRTLILTNTLIATFAATLLMSALNTALAQVCDDIGINVTSGQWLISGEILAMGIVMPLTAFMMRRFRTRRLYLAAIIIFMAGLVMAMLSQNFPVMVAGRVLQGCGNGMLMTMGQVIVLSIYPPEERGGAMGMYGLAIAVAPLVAPTLGGILADTAGWRSIFFMDLVVMGFSFVMALCVFKNVLDTEKIKVDFSSFILSILAFGGLTVGVGFLSNNGISPIVWIALIIGAVGMVIFVRRQVRLPKPFLDMKILKSRNFTLAVIASMLIYCVLLGSGVVMPLYVQNVLGYSATIAGLVFLPGSLLMVIMSPFAGRFYDKHGIKGMFVVGSVGLVASFILLATMTENSSLLLPILYNVIRFGSATLIQMQVITWSTTQVEPAQITDASALLQALRTIAGSVGSTVFVGIMSTVSVNSAATYGDRAAAHGVSVAFIGTAICSAAVLVIAIIVAREKPISNEMT